MTTNQMINEIRNTVGYMESENKKEFIKGAKMGYDICSNAAWKMIGDTQKHAESLAELLSNREEDLQTLANIIQKYTSND